MKINWYRYWVAVVFWIVENQHFGWWMMPQSDAELIADGMVAILLALSFMPSQ